MGNDTFNMGANLTTADRINGGGGNDIVTLNGDYSTQLTFGTMTITNVETISLAAGHSYNLATNNSNLATGQTLTVNGSALAAGNNLTFSGAAENDCQLHYRGRPGQQGLP